MNKIATVGVVMLANGHPVFDTRIFIKEARTLVQAGYKVSLVIPADQDVQHEGVSILAVPLAKKGWQKLIVNPWNILRKAWKQPATSIYHIHDSDILIIGILLKLSGRKVIYDAHEDTPLQISYQHWIPALLKRPYTWFYFILEKICGWLFDGIIVAEPVIAKYFPEKKTYLIRNFPLVDSFRLHKATPYQERKKRLIHIGTLSKVRGLFEMLESAKIAHDKTPFDFFLGGKFSPADLGKKILSLYRVSFLGRVSYTDLVDLLFDSRVGIIIPHPIERYKTNYPVKLFEFMAAGLPVIASQEGESAAFVREAQCGILVDPLNIKQISEAIVWLFAHPEEAEAMGRRGQQLIFNEYNWKKESLVMLDLYARLNI
jgi:glycosyltransferase involved in cell wall biosynthesis